jgi:hypothetical protein
MIPEEFNNLVHITTPLENIPSQIDVMRMVIFYSLKIPF